MLKLNKIAYKFFYFIFLLSFFIISCDERFNRENWLNDIETRKKMIKDLTRNVLIKKKKQEIIKLFGAPDTTYFKNADLVYFLGNKSAIISIDSDWFLIYLDKNGFYYRYEIKTD
jgi:hypothetical protein